MNNYSYTFFANDFTGKDNVRVSYDLIKICELNSCNITRGIITVYNKYNPSKFEKYLLWYDGADDSPTIGMGIINDISHIKLVCVESVGMMATERYSKLVYIIKDTNNACFIAVSKNIYKNAVINIDITTNTSSNTYEPLSNCNFNRYISFSDLDSYVQSSSTGPNHFIMNYNDHSYFCLAENVDKFYTKIIFKWEQANAGRGINGIGSVEVLLDRDKFSVEFNRINSGFVFTLNFYYVANSDNTYNIYMHQGSPWESFKLLSFDPIYYNDSLPEGAVKIQNIYHCGDTIYRPSLDIIDEGFQYFDSTLKKPIWWNGSAWIDKDGNPADAKKQGTTEQRPSSVQIGYIYKDTTLNKLIVWEGTKWVNIDGTELA